MQGHHYLAQEFASLRSVARQALLIPTIYSLVVNAEIHELEAYSSDFMKILTSLESILSYYSKGKKGTNLNLVGHSICIMLYLYRESEKYRKIELPLSKISMFLKEWTLLDEECQDLWCMAVSGISFILF